MFEPKKATETHPPDTKPVETDVPGTGPGPIKPVHVDNPKPTHIPTHEK